MYSHINDIIWKPHGCANVTPVCEQEPCFFPTRRGMAFETNSGLGTFEAILNTIPSGWRKVLTLLPNEFGEVVTNPNNKVQYVHNHKFEPFLYMQQWFTHIFFGVGTIQPLLTKFI